VETPASGGAACPALTENQPCNTTPCVNCEVNPWGDWSSCSAACGGGTQTRSRTVETPASGGAACPALTENQPCNAYSCPHIIINDSYKNLNCSELQQYCDDPTQGFNVRAVCPQTCKNPICFDASLQKPSKDCPEQWWSGKDHDFFMQKLCNAAAHAGKCCSVDKNNPSNQCNKAASKDACDKYTSVCKWNKNAAVC